MSVSPAFTDRKSPKKELYTYSKQTPPKPGYCPRIDDKRDRVSILANMSVFSIIFLTLKVPITTAADDIHKYFFIVFQRKIRLDVSSESSARQRIHMKNQALFSSKDKSKKLKCRLLQFLFGALRVNLQTQSIYSRKIISVRV